MDSWILPPMRRRCARQPQGEIQGSVPPGAESAYAAPMTYRLIIFDFDGVLADTAGWFLRAYEEVAQRFGLARLSPAELDALRGLGNREIVARLKTPAWKLPLIAAHVRNLMRRDIGAIQLFAGVPELLAELTSRGVTIAIVSSNSEANVRAVLGASADLVRRYDCGAAIFGKARKFRKLVRDLGAPAEAVLCVGDETRDIEAAREAGLTAAAAAWGYARPSALSAAGPDLMFSSVEDLRRALDDARAKAS